MSGQAAAVQGWPLLLLALVVSPVVSTPTGPFPALVPRRWRWWWRKHRHHGVRARQRSSRPPKWLVVMVERADRHRCAVCGATRRDKDRRGRRVVLQVDHRVPWIVGGLTCLWNCHLLCSYHNLVKSAYWEAPSGRVYYRRGYRAPAEARRIVAKERAALANPLRWLRAFGVLPPW